MANDRNPERGEQQPKSIPTSRPLKKAAKQRATEGKPEAKAKAGAPASRRTRPRSVGTLDASLEALREPAKRDRAGRLSPYADGFHTSFADLGHRLALLGLRDQDIAAVFGVADSTLSKWKNDHPTFSEALKRGKAPADGLVVASLFARATGYMHEETDVRVIDGTVVQTKIQRHFPPDVTACIFWLKNRQRGQWRDGITVSEEPPPITPLELAKRIAFALRLGDEARKNQVGSGSAVHGAATATRLMPPLATGDNDRKDIR